MNKLKYLLICGLITGAAAHAQSERETFCPPVSSLTEEIPNGIALAIKALNGLDTFTLETGIAKGNVQRVLASVHPMLADPNGECRITDSEYTLQVLPRITNDMLFDLASGLPSDGRHGFSILSSAFWQSVQNLQSKDVRIAWILDAPVGVNGVFIRSTNTIGINPSSDVPTLAHEARHFSQAHQFDYREELETYFINRQATLGYASTCLPVLNRYFAELDASTEDVVLWQDYLDSALEIANDSNAFLASGFPQLELFRVNLGYAETVANEVIVEDSCPNYFRIAAKEIRSKIKVDEWMSAASRLRSLLTVAQTELRTNPSCSKGGCKRYDKLLADAEALRAKLAVSLAPYATERKKEIVATLKKLPKADRRLWCQYSGAFKLLAKCED